MSASQTLRVIDRVSLEVYGRTDVLFSGTREQCYAFMRRYRNPAKHFDLMYDSGRLSSWAL